MRVLVVTVVHTAEDARIFHREVQALLRAGHHVTLAAPRASTHSDEPGLTAVDLPRAVGRRRLHALLAARRMLRSIGPLHDVAILHDPELLLCVPRRTTRPVIWDVHEDLRAALVDKPWIPRSVRHLLGPLVALLERRAEARFSLLLAEEGYQERFRRTHPVVPNEPYVPATVRGPGTHRVVYLGRLSDGRGGRLMIECAELLPDGIVVELMGESDPELRPALEVAAEGGLLTWSGRVPNDEGLARLEGALCGLSLLRDLPNYRHSRPTKVVEYMARGIPVVSTPLPIATDIIERHQCGIVVPFDDPWAAAEAVAQLAADRELRERLGRNGHRAALSHYSWEHSGPRFVAEVEAAARA